jgi:hypothetical protein
MSWARHLFNILGALQTKNNNLTQLIQTWLGPGSEFAFASGHPTRHSNMAIPGPTTKYTCDKIQLTFFSVSNFVRRCCRHTPGPSTLTVKCAPAADHLIVWWSGTFLQLITKYDALFAREVLYSKPTHSMCVLSGCRRLCERHWRDYSHKFFVSFRRVHGALAAKSIICPGRPRELLKYRHSQCSASALMAVKMYKRSVTACIGFELYLFACFQGCPLVCEGGLT